MSTDKTVPPVHRGLLLALYVLEAAGVLFALALYKFSGRLFVLTVRQWAWIFASLTLLLASGVYIVLCYLRTRDSDPRGFSFTVAANLLTVVIVLAASEVIVRALSVPTDEGLSVAGTRLLPRRWEQVRARNAELLNNTPSKTSYFTSDTLLGWTIAPSRRSTDGLYLSSAEGIRSHRVGMAYDDCPAPYRIALVGDSFTFGLDGPFGDTWGFQLEQALGRDCVVLNFGVDGYGVDQAYLRYLRDVRPWRPAVTIFGFIDNDLYRSLSVYSFVTFPEWGFPYSKPRFVLNAGKLSLLNVPLIRPDSVLMKRSVRELPFIEYDVGYDPAEWEGHSYAPSRLLRYILSRFPRYPLVRREVGDDALTQLNAELLLAFARQAKADGTVPLIVYFPSRNDFTHQPLSGKDAVLALLRRSGVQYLDLTPCIAAIDVTKAFRDGSHHYSMDGNAAVTRCLLPSVRRYLPRE